MEIAKNIAAILGLILSCASVITLCSDKVKKIIASIFKKYNQEQDEDIEEIKQSIKAMRERMEEQDKKLDELVENGAIALDFTRQQCRNIIKDMFYKYYDTKVLPLYEYKTLMYVSDIYIKQLNGNSYAFGLITEMKKWEVDYKSVRIEIEEE